MTAYSRLAFACGAGLALGLGNQLAGYLLRFGRYEWDKDFGYVRRNSQIVYRLEGNGVSHWLERGVRDNGNGTVAGPRVLILGDSQTEALQVADKETFVSLAEQGLRQKGQPVNLLNCGHAGRSVADYVKLAPAFSRELRPDWTVALVSEVDFGLDAWHAGQTHFELAPDGSLRLAPEPGAPRLPRSSPPPGPLSSTQALLQRRAGAFGERWRSQPRLFRAGQIDIPAGPPRKYPIGAAAELLADAYGPRLTLLLRRNFAGYAKPFRATPGQLEIEDVCRRRGIRLIDLAAGYPELVALGEAPCGFANTSWNAGHYNAVGHAWIARQLQRELEELHQNGIL